MITFPLAQWKGVKLATRFLGWWGLRRTDYQAWKPLTMCFSNDVVKYMTIQFVCHYNGGEQLKLIPSDPKLICKILIYELGISPWVIKSHLSKEWPTWIQRWSKGLAGLERERELGPDTDCQSLWWVFSFKRQVWTIWPDTPQYRHMPVDGLLFFFAVWDSNIF